MTEDIRSIALRLWNEWCDSPHQTDHKCRTEQEWDRLFQEFKTAKSAEILTELWKTFDLYE